MAQHRLGKFLLERKRSGGFVVTLCASNGRTLVVSETYETKRAALAAIEAVRRVAADARFEDRSDDRPVRRTSQVKKDATGARQSRVASPRTASPRTGPATSSATTATARRRPAKGVPQDGTPTTTKNGAPTRMQERASRRSVPTTSPTPTAGTGAGTKRPRKRS